MHYATKERGCLSCRRAESAAKTATMLSNAVIADKQISVKYYFENEYTSEHTDSTGAAGAADGTSVEQEDKAKSSIVAELLASGFALSEGIIKRAQDFDAKFGVLAKAQDYYTHARGELAKIDEKYKVREMVVTRATALNNTYNITDKIYYAAGQVQDAATRALQSGPGQQASRMLSQAATRAIDTVAESRKIAEEKKSE
ncbi:hypothetical protein THASP1DRAFT_14813 [Thamnocephalis sphaerospora]|uniref:Uncharacterized protein n=1 Tax=Thamnocephalis sphaerospora TaxID=78915 RepID=A0A4V1IWW9_9FUNG|nr:hypothetical protein THASP1DRAFT_14813 [Thamnocephalis sphaerospora]|eukprot:RKP09019.1 hypothetical protein THASP1DRAFT_14813 [Thamnocephalis sphaerospora]